MVHFSDAMAHRGRPVTSIRDRILLRRGGDPRGHDARSIANYFIKRSKDDGIPKTHLQILKLVYFSHAVMLAAYDRPMVAQPFEAWEFGPVVPDIYHSLKQYGRSHIDAEIPSFAIPDFDTDELSSLQGTLKSLGGLSGGQLSHITHWPNSPWFSARLRGRGSVIDNNEIRDYYKEYLIEDDD